MPKNIRKVKDIQASPDYEHKPGVKNKALKNLRKYEFLSYQYRDRKKHTDVTTDDETLKMKYKESEAKHGYYNYVYHASK